MPDTTTPITNPNPAFPNPIQPTQTTPTPAPPTNPLSLRLFVRDRRRVVFDDEVKAVTSVNAKGVFDILPQHENFISLNKQYITVHKKDGQEEKIPIDNGLLKVTNNQISIYINLLSASTKPATPSVAAAPTASINPPQASSAPQPSK